MHRIVVLQLAPGSPASGQVASFEDRYTGAGSHRFQCGACGYAVARGVDPYLYPVMFEGASHIRCSRCESINALPIDL